VNNFKDPYCPKKLLLDKGGAKVFRDEMNKLIDEAQTALLRAFESKEYADKRQSLMDDHKQKEMNLFKGIHEKASSKNFVISRTPIEIIVVPVDARGNPIDNKSFSQLDKKQQEDLMQKRDELMEELKSLLRENRELERQSQDALIELDRSVALYAIELILEELKEKYNKKEDVLAHLEAVKKNIMDNLGAFLNAAGPRGDSDDDQEKKWLEYDVNILTDNSKLEGAPIVMETNPTYHNLFGKVEQESYMGTLVTDFTLIRGGSLHKANGGYLIIPLKELLMNYFSYDSLKRALKTGHVNIEDASDRFGFMSAKSLKPDPIPLSVQIILIGSPILYHMLYKWDEDFNELFRVKAEFDTSMPYSAENAYDFAGVIHNIEKENGLLSINNRGLVRILEESLRLAGDQKRISIRFGELGKILQEANHYALLDSRNEIDAADLERAIEYKYFRSNLIQEKINEMIRRNTLMIDLQGSKTGQINAIPVIDLGDIMFGRPNKITVSMATGKEGLVDIEREVKLGGPIHSKGVLILNGYLREHYGQDKLISLMACLVFEQSYSEIEGDSASSAELYAILSALSGLPINQGIAVTGSVNQKGEVQPIGAVNEKVEGYFEVCRQHGLTGDQGVILPKANQDNLMLKPGVVKAVNDGKFHIWAVDTIDQGIEILTDCPAGRKLKRGSFTKDSVHYRVDQRIRDLNEPLSDKKRKKG
jgi:lon-related putative ATP-dependent protease